MLTNDLATYLIKQKSAIIKADGTIDWPEDELAMKRKLFSHGKPDRTLLSEAFAQNFLSLCMIGSIHFGGLKGRRKKGGSDS